MRATHSMRAVLKIRDFRNLWIALGLSSLGDWLGLLALTAMANSWLATSARCWATPTAPVRNFAIAGVLFLRLAARRSCSGRSPARSPTGSTGAWTLVVGDFLRAALFLSIPLVGTL